MHNGQSFAKLEVNRYLGPATVLGVDGTDPTGEHLWVSSVSSSEEEWVGRARLAISGNCNMEEGEQVLVTGEAPDNLYVIGVLAGRNSTETKTHPSELRLQSGAGARTVGTGESERLQVFSKTQELLFEYDPVSGKAQINAASGSLELTAPRGDIVLRAGGHLKFGAEEIDLISRRGTRSGIMDSLGRLKSAVALDQRGVQLLGDALDVSADHGHFQVEETAYNGRRFNARVGVVKLVSDTIETAATAIVEKARNVYRTVEELSQLKTGRMRTLIQATFHLKARKTVMRAEEDFRIDGEKIHLG